MNDPVTRVLRPLIASSASRWPRIDTLLALGVVLAILIGVVLFFAKFPSATIGGNPTAAPTAAVAGVPNVIGMRLMDAIPALQRSGYEASWDFDAKLSGAPCTVQREQPAAGTIAARGTRIALTYVPGSGCVPKSD